MDIKKMIEELENSIMSKNEINARQILTRLLDFGVYLEFNFEEKAKPPPPIINKPIIPIPINPPPVFKGPLNVLKH